MGWKTKFENPAVIAASVASFTTLLITLVTTGSALITTHIQAQASVERAVMETKRALILSVFGTEPNPKYKLKYMIDAGLLPDDDSKLRIVVLDYSQDCRPPPSN